MEPATQRLDLGDRLIYRTGRITLIDSCIESWSHHEIFENAIEGIESVISQLDITDTSEMIFAGGFISGMMFDRDYGDIDIYVSKSFDYDLVSHMEIVDNIGNCLTMLYDDFKIQIIRCHSFHPNCFEVFRSFDMTQCMFAYKSGSIYTYHKAFTLALEGVGMINTIPTGLVINERNTSRIDKYRARRWDIKVLTTKGIRKFNENTHNYIRVGGMILYGN